MTDLVSRVLAAIEAKAEKARAATPGPWRIPHASEPSLRCGGHYVEFVARDGERCAYSPDVTFHPDGGPPGGSIGLEDAVFVADNDPAAVLRRCKADRDLVEKYREIEAESDRVIGLGYAEPDDMVAERLAFEWVIKNRAASYGISVEEETTGE